MHSSSPMKTPREQGYARRFAKVLDFIDKHLDEPLSIEQLSSVAHFSKFHFHRQFTNYVGMAPNRYIQLVRLRRASQRLAYNVFEPITNIALQAGFEHAESFSRAFKNAFGQSPSAFRKNPDHAIQRVKAMQVRTVNVEPVRIAVLEHRGNPALLNESVQRFIAWRKESGLSPVATSATYGVAWSDPTTTPPEDFRFDICGAVETKVPANRHAIVNKMIPGGRCAVVRHKGSPDHISSSVYYLYRSWLPHSGEEPRDFPVYFHYLNLKGEMPESELLTDVYLPLR